jgi:hypothetical protein
MPMKIYLLFINIIYTAVKTNQKTFSWDAPHKYFLPSSILGFHNPLKHILRNIRGRKNTEFYI